MEKKNKGLIITIIILAICVLGLGGFIIYDKVINKEEIEENTLSDKQLDILGKSLYKKVMNVYSVDYYPFFDQNRLYQDDFDNEAKLSIAYNYVLRNQIIGTSNTLKNLQDMDLPVTEYFCGEDGTNCQYDVISKDDFLSAYYSIWGYEENVTIELFSTYNLYNCDLYNDNIYCLPYIGGFEGFDFQLINYYKTEKKDGDILVFAKFDRIGDNDTIYKDPEETIKLIDNIEINVDEYLDGTYIEKLEKYIADGGVIKVTFKLDKLGNYYWYSSELQ